MGISCPYKMLDLAFVFGSRECARCNFGDEDYGVGHEIPCLKYQHD